MKAMSKSKVSRKSVRKCCICGKPAFSPKSNHCFACFVMIRRMEHENLPPECIKEICEHVRRYGHVCFYTKIRLDRTDPKSPFYFVFDHMVPGEDKVVLTFALLNEMKSDMIPKEFWYYILQLDRYFRTGQKIRKIKLSRWYRLAPLLEAKQGAMMLLPSESLKALAKKCCLCGKPVYAPRAMYCPGCHQFVHSMDNRGINNDAAKKILKYVHRHGFVCEYTETPLNMTDYKDPFYYEFDHTVPGASKVALTFSLLNEMKSEMTLKEFKYYVGQFANFLRTGAKIKKRKLSHWFMLAQK